MNTQDWSKYKGLTDDGVWQFGVDYAIAFTSGYIMLCQMGRSFKVKAETLCRFVATTPFGVDLYDGDIVRRTHSVLPDNVYDYVITYKEKHARWGLKYKDGINTSAMHDMLTRNNLSGFTYTVIGNIHDPK